MSKKKKSTRIWKNKRLSRWLKACRRECQMWKEQCQINDELYQDIRDKYIETEELYQDIRAKYVEACAHIMKLEERGQSSVEFAKLRAVADAAMLECLTIDYVERLWEKIAKDLVSRGGYMEIPRLFKAITDALRELQ